MVLFSGCKPKVEPAIPSDPQVEKQIKEWIKKMTLDEKVGQMLELNIDVMGGYVNGKWVLEEGEFVITIGGQAVKINATETHKWETPNI